MDFKRGEHMFICGRTGTGKSYFLRYFIKNIIKEDFIIFDIKQEDFNDLGRIVTNYSDFVKYLTNGENKIIIQDKKLNINTIEKYLKFLNEKCSNFNVVVDELHLLCSKHKISNSMKRILQVGRSKFKSFIGASQRTADIHNAVMSQCTHKISFYLSIKSDKKRMGEELGAEESIFDKLNEYEFIYLYDKGKNKPYITKI